MEKLLVIGNFACHDGCEDDLFASQWSVGIFDTITDCLEAALEDLRQVGRDHYECVLDTDMFDTAAEFELAVEDKVVDYVENHWVRGFDIIKKELEAFGHTEFLSNDFCCEDTDQRQITKYTVYKLEFGVKIR